MDYVPFLQLTWYFEDGHVSPLVLPNFLVFCKDIKMIEKGSSRYVFIVVFHFYLLLAVGKVTDPSE
ncbi:hypothetical protein Leryth_018848, partial [Lithospermum erythrorhizon]